MKKMKFISLCLFLAFTLPYIYGGCGGSSGGGGSDDDDGGQMIHSRSQRLIMISAVLPRTIR